MVSFFGLKFGSDRKKDKANKKSLDKPTRKPTGEEETGLGEGNLNFSRPQRPLSRPGTSYSTNNRKSTFLQSPYADNVAAASSMVDLAPPGARRPSLGSLRQISSSGNLKGGRPHISGPIGPPVSLPMDGGDDFPGTPLRPSTSSSMKQSWVNPLDVHFGKDLGSKSGSRPGTPRDAGSGATRSHLSNFELAPSSPKSENDKKKGDLDTGYPSPPASMKNSDRHPSFSSIEPKRPNPPSTLRRVDTAERAHLPSPSLSGDEVWDAPVIRNVLAKRDTLTFHSPRRRSFAKNIAEADLDGPKRPKTAAEKDEIKKKRQTEGFEGNFSAFNFGGPSPVDPDMPMPPAAQSLTNWDYQRAESPVDLSWTKQQDWENRDASKDGMAESISSLSTDRREEDETEVGDSFMQPLSQPPQGELPRPPIRARQDSQSTLTGTYHGRNNSSMSSFRGPMRPRVDSDTRAPGTPTALRAPHMFAGSPDMRSRSPAGSFYSDDLADVPPPSLNPERRSQSPLSRPPIEGDFPKVRGLPRGRRPGPPPPIPLMSQASAGDGYGMLRHSSGDPEDTTFGSPMMAPPEKHFSAIPAPLSPMRPDFAPLSQARPDGPDTEDFNDWASSPTAPRLPSPTFPSLEKSISSSSEDLAKTFEMHFSSGPSLPNLMKAPLISPVMSEFQLRQVDGRSSPGRRVEAKKAPPRPSPITLSPSRSTTSGTATPESSIRSPVEFSPGFI